MLIKNRIGLNIKLDVMNLALVEVERNIKDVAGKTHEIRRLATLPPSFYAGTTRKEYDNMQFDSFYKYFPEIAKRETREIVINRPSGTLSGGYGLLEMYCTDPECDCRRVMFNIVSEKEKTTVAVIGYGWEDEDFYEKWYGEKDINIINDMRGPSLNSASRQTKYAPELLEVIENVVLQDEDYVDRLKKHYEIFKQKLEDTKVDYEDDDDGLTVVKSTVKIARNDLCPCGSRKKYKKCCGHNV